ncbi:MAG: cupin domain-containing protein [Actinomycetota bacterium]
MPFVGSWVHEHSYENEEVWNFIEGTFEVSVEGQTFVAGPGTAAVVPPNVKQGLKALSDGRAVVVDHPVRLSVGSVDLD